LPASIDGARAAGFSAYPTKPLNVQQVLDTIDRIFKSAGPIT